MQRYSTCQFQLLFQPSCHLLEICQFLHERTYVNPEGPATFDLAAIAEGATKANASNVIKLINENVIFFDNIRFISLFLWNKIFKLKPKNLTEGKNEK